MLVVSGVNLRKRFRSIVKCEVLIEPNSDFAVAVKADHFGGNEKIVVVESVDSPESFHAADQVTDGGDLFKLGLVAEQLGQMLGVDEQLDELAAHACLPLLAGAQNGH